MGSRRFIGKMTLIQLCALCDNGLIHYTYTYPLSPNKLYARESCTRFEADNLLNLIPNDGAYSARIVDCYFDAPISTRTPSKTRKHTAFLRIDELFSDGYRRTDRSDKLYHSRLIIDDKLRCQIIEPHDIFLPINTSFMSDRLSKEILIHIETVDYIRSETPPGDKLSFNLFSPYEDPIVIFVVIELRKDDAFQ